MDKVALNAVLEQLFAETVRMDGKQFEPSSLASIQAGIDRYLRENGCLFSIFKDIEFRGSRDVLEGRAKYLRETLGMGNKPGASLHHRASTQIFLVHAITQLTHVSRAL